MFDGFCHSPKKYDSIVYGLSSQTAEKNGGFCHYPYCVIAGNPNYCTNPHIYPLDFDLYSYLNIPRTCFFSIPYSICGSVLPQNRKVFPGWKKKVSSFPMVSSFLGHFRALILRLQETENRLQLPIPWCYRALKHCRKGSSKHGHRGKMMINNWI